MQVQRKISKIKIEKNSNKSDSICEEKHIPNSPQIFNKKRMVLFKNLTI
jgi:lipoate synthase